MCFKIKAGLVQIVVISLHQFDLKDDLAVSLSQIQHHTHFRCLMFKMVPAFKSRSLKQHQLSVRRTFYYFIISVKGNGKYRSSHQRCSVKKGVPRNFAKFTGKHLCRRLFFNKVAGLGFATLLTKNFWYRFFPVNFAKFLRTPFIQNTSGRLLLELLV